MPRAKAHANLFLDMDTRALEASVGQIGAFTQALNQVGYNTARVVFNKLKNDFMDDVDRVAELDAATDPRGQGRFHHLYEPQEVGNPAARLYNFVIPQEVRNRSGSGQLYARVDYFKSTQVERSWGNLKSGSMYHRYTKYRKKPFFDKARVLEEGIDITVPEGTWFVQPEQNLRRGRPLSLIQVQSDKSGVSTRNRETYHALHDHFNMFLNGGLGESSIVQALDAIDRRVVDATMHKLGREIQRIDAKYKLHRTSGSSRNIFTGRISSGYGRRSHIKQSDVNEYKEHLRKRLYALIVERGLQGQV